MFQVVKEIYKDKLSQSGNRFISSHIPNDVTLFLNSYFQMECGPNKCPQLVLFLLNILVFVSTIVENLNIFDTHTHK